MTPPTENSPVYKVWLTGSSESGAALSGSLLVVKSLKDGLQVCVTFADERAENGILTISRCPFNMKSCTKPRSQPTEVERRPGDVMWQHVGRGGGYWGGIDISPGTLGFYWFPQGPQMWADAGGRGEASDDLLGSDLMTFRHVCTWLCTCDGALDSRSPSLGRLDTCLGPQPKG